MRITTWNVNSIRAREDRVLNWLDRERPDVLCMQELKCVEEQFPYDGFEQLGYYVTLLGQKTYNGVAIATLDLPQEPVSNIPWPEDEAARGLAVASGDIRVASLYIPNGQSVGSDKYAYKLEWLERLRAWLGAEHNAAEPLVLAGDFNIAPADLDVHDPERWHEKVLCSTAEREHLQALLDWGLSDSFRHVHQDGGHYTWWDFRTNAYQRNDGLRIDHLLVTEPVLERTEDVAIDVDEREEQPGSKPSDHAPVTLTLAD